MLHKHVLSTSFIAMATEGTSRQTIHWLSYLAVNLRRCKV